jgi:riboflavin kinase/FMN adenylyltransferase
MKRTLEEIMYPIFTGKVAHGSEIGRTLGFPTANIEAATNNIPQDGVYIAAVQIDNLQYYGIMSIGNRPTFDAKNKTIEVHLLDFSGDLYQQTLKIKPLSFIRENKKFDTLDLLKQQLQEDKDFAYRNLPLLKREVKLSEL